MWGYGGFVCPFERAGGTGFIILDGEVGGSVPMSVCLGASGRWFTVSLVVGSLCVMLSSSGLGRGFYDQVYGPICMFLEIVVIRWFEVVGVSSHVVGICLGMSRNGLL